VAFLPLVVIEATIAVGRVKRALAFNGTRDEEGLA